MKPDRGCIIDISDYVIHENIMYAVSNKLNGVIVGNINNEAVNYIGNLQFIDDAHTSCIMSERKLYCPSMQGNEVFILDIDKNLINNVSLPPIKNKEHIFNKFYNSVAYQDKIFFLPGQYPYIVKYEVGKKIDVCELDIKRLAVNGNVFMESIVIHNNKIIMGSWSNNIICVFNMDNNEINYYDIPGDTSGFRTLCYDGKDMFFSDNKGRIGIIDIKKRELLYVYENKDEVYRKSIYWQDKFIFFPENGNEIITINSAEQKIEHVLCPEVKTRNVGYGRINIYDDRLTIYNYDSRKMLFFNKDLELDYVMQYYVKDKYFDLKFEKNVLIKENSVSPDLTLKNYISNVKKYFN